MQMQPIITGDFKNLADEKEFKQVLKIVLQNEIYKPEFYDNADMNDNIQWVIKNFKKYKIYQLLFNIIKYYSHSHLKLNNIKVDINYLLITDGRSTYYKKELKKFKNKNISFKELSKFKKVLRKKTFKNFFIGRFILRFVNTCRETIYINDVSYSESESESDSEYEEVTEEEESDSDYGFYLTAEELKAQNSATTYYY